MLRVIEVKIKMQRQLALVSKINVEFATGAGSELYNFQMTIFFTLRYDESKFSHNVRE